MRVRSRPAALAAAASLAASAAGLYGGCTDAAQRRRDCSSAIWIPSSIDNPRVLSSINQWSLPLTPERYDESAWLLRLQLPPGEHQYLIAGDGKEPFLDPLNPLTAFRASDEHEVSLLLVEDCSVGLLTADEGVMSDTGEVTLSGRFLAGEGAAKLDSDSLRADAEGATLRVTADADAGTWSASGSGFGPGKHTFTISAKDTDGLDAEPATVSLWVEPRAKGFADATIYQVMIDRFRGDGGAPLEEPPTKGSRAGGTLAGVTAALEDGSLERLGVTMLWLSPVYQNPSEAREGADGRMYESYHGYWPVDGRRVDTRLGGEAALEALVAAAHQRGISVILDLVPNHVYETNPLFLERKDEGWFNPTGCVCGAPDCPWGDHIRECWFTPYLPDIHWQQAGTMQHAADEAQFWFDRFGVDGFRIDAVPMMQRAATRRIAYALRGSRSELSPPFLLGEVFTGPGEGALGQLGAYLGPATLDGVFDFPLMWALRNAIAAGDPAGFAEVDAILDAGDETFGGSGAAIAHMLDNHDVSRFASVSGGGAGNNPWDDPPPQPQDEDVYLRQALGLATIYTLPGIPTLYYGDEIALAGASDPDSRRVMPADDTLNVHQLALRAKVEALASLRSCSDALRSSERERLYLEGGVYVYLRSLGDVEVAVVLNANEEETPIPEGTLPEGDWRDALDGTSVPDGTGFMAPRLSYRVLLRPGDPCAQ